MPYKNPDDKQAWNNANKEKQKEYRLRWAQSDAGLRYLEKQIECREIQKQLNAEQRKQKKQLSEEDIKELINKKNEKHKRYRAKQRAIAIELLGGECQVCGMNDRDVLEFDHIEPLLRRTNKTRSKSGTEKQIIDNDNRREEFQLLCSNCHTKKTRFNGEFSFKNCNEQ